MVLMIVRPLQEGRDEFFQVWAHDVGGHGMNGELNKAKYRLDYFSVRGGEVDEERGEDLG